MFQVVFPIVADIGGDSFNEAVKNFIKINHNLNISDMIIKDQSQHMRAQIKYYEQDGRNKVGINMFPIGMNYPLPVVTKDGYKRQTVMESPFALSPFMPFLPQVQSPGAVLLQDSPLYSISPTPISPMPFIPTVIKMPSGL